jgi:hypothetical protein
MAIEAQTRQPQRGLTFEDVWAALMETDRRQQETDRQMQETDRRMQESKAEHDRRMQESKAEYDRQMQESKTEHDRWMQEMEKIVKELSKNVGGVNKSFGRLMEEMYSARLWNKFTDFGYGFTSGCRRKKFWENERTIAEVDIFLENGLYAMPVEVKADLTTEDVDEHLERIATIRDYMDSHGDKRVLVGAVAGGIAPENVVKYAQKKGLYVVGWSGDAAMIVEAPPSFKGREWVCQPQ